MSGVNHIYNLSNKTKMQGQIRHLRKIFQPFQCNLRWGDGEMGRWGDGEMGRWGDGEMGRIIRQSIVNTILN